MKNFLTTLSNEGKFELLQRGRAIHHRQWRFVPVRKKNRSGQWRLKQTTSSSNGSSTIDNHVKPLFSSFNTEAISAAPSCVIALPSLGSQTLHEHADLGKQREKIAVHIQGPQTCVVCERKCNCRASDISENIVIDMKDFKRAVCLQVRAQGFQA